MVLLVPAFIIAAFMALMNLGVGGPQVNIDDYTLYEGGFLVWFGHAPPQHAYLECWINGVASLITFICKSALHGQITDVFGLEFVPRAYSDFYYYPDLYYLAYRLVVTLFFLATSVLIYFIARQCVPTRISGYAPALASVFYLFSFNAYWSNLAGRPDTLVVFFAMLGYYFYLRSEYRIDTPWFWLAAGMFGLAAGLKLHGAFFAIFATLDLLRVKGFRSGVRGGLILVGLSLLFFVLADGSLLFDPLKYVKARMMTYRDDHSTYLKWGGQFLSILRGSGWVVVPLLLGARFCLKKEAQQAKIRSVVFFALCWLVLFASIRQLRAYWMLPALPLFYISALVVLDRLRQLRWSAIALVVAVLLLQSVLEVRKIYASPYNELRRWIETTVTDNDALYLVGYTVLRVPRSESANVLLRKCIVQSVTEDAPRYGFVYRHLKNWEELTTLRLLDMLIPQAGKGINMIGYLERSVNFGNGDEFLKPFNYIIVQDRFGFDDMAGLKQYLERYFIQLGSYTGEGGEGYGLPYHIYKRKTED